MAAARASAVSEAAVAMTTEAQELAASGETVAIAMADRDGRRLAAARTAAARMTAV